MSTKPLFKRPLWKDWTVWLGSAGAFSSVRSTWPTYYGQPMNDSNMLAYTIDLLFGLATGWGLFAILPAAIRRRLRRPVTAPDSERGLHAGLAREFSDAERALAQQGSRGVRAVAIWAVVGVALVVWAAAKS